MLSFKFKSLIPKIFHDDPNSEILANKIDTHLDEWKKEILDIKRFIRPDEVPAIFLNELGIFLEANINEGDSETVKRKKVYNAIVAHKIRGTFNDHVKILIDAITGLSPGARILRWNHFYTSDWIWLDQTPSLVPASPSDYWTTWGTDGVDTDTGLDWIGAGTEIEISGNIYIDCHEGVNVATLTAAQIATLVLELEKDVVPAYMRVFLGYIDAGGLYVIYATID